MPYLSAAALRAREKRLEQLALGFGRETDILFKADAKLTSAERQAYIAALVQARDAVKAARRVLAQARERVEAEG